MVNGSPIYFYKTKSLSNLRPSSLIAVKVDGEDFFSLYVTDKTGVPFPIKDETGGGGGGTITAIQNTDGNLTITGTTTKTINVSPSLLSLINSALQAGDNISELTNDAGYITLADVPTFAPTDYDLEDFNNLSSDPFVRQSEMTSGGATNLSYTANPTNGVVTSDTGTDATIPLATSTDAGLLSPAEKTKLEGIEAGAEVNNISDTNATDLTDGGETTLHHHDSRYYTETESDNKFVPYTGATTDVDLDAFSLNAKSLHIKGTAGQGHLGLKHQSSNPTANANETTLFSGSDGELYYKNDSLSVAQIASRAWVNAQGFITNVLTALGFTPENVVNKATSFDSPNNTTYPTTQAVQTALNGKENKTESFVLTSPYVLTSQTALQSFMGQSFDVVAGTYRFKVRFAGSGFANSNNIQFGLLGTATITRTAWDSNANKAASFPATNQIIISSSTTAQPITTASTATSAQGLIEGLVTFSGSGTFIPAIGMGTAAAASINTGTIELTQIS